LDRETLSKAAQETQGLIVIEDHWCEGGLGEAVAATVSSLTPVYQLAISAEPHSGKPTELLDHYGISRKAIEEKIMRLIS
jgi:transketolase